MSKFNSYAQKVDQIAKAAFEEYRKAEADYKKAQEEFSKYPAILTGSVGAEYYAKKARAEANFLQAKEDKKAAERVFESHKKEIAAIRKELAAELDDHYAADPAALDNNTLELLKSGILSSSEYSRLLNAAQETNNHTMARVIAKYAGDAADQISNKYGDRDQRARELRAVSYEARSSSDGSKYLEAFDNMADIYNRCVKNPGMIEHWGEFTAETVENF